MRPSQALYIICHILINDILLEVAAIQLSSRQELIIKMLKESGPLTAEQISSRLDLSKPTIRPDLAVLSLAGFLDAKPKVGYFVCIKENQGIFMRYVRTLKVAELMSTPTIVQENSSAFDAGVRFFTDDVGSVYIVDHENSLVGVASRKDFLRVSLGGADLEKLPVSMLMTKHPNVQFVKEDDDIYTAAKILRDFSIESLPVISFSNSPHDESKRILKVLGRISLETINSIFVEAGEVLER